MRAAKNLSLLGENRFQSAQGLEAAVQGLPNPREASMHESFAFAGCLALAMIRKTIYRRGEPDAADPQVLAVNRQDPQCLPSPTALRINGRAKAIMSLRARVVLF